MSTFKARGIVLKENFVGESDKFVSLLLKGVGKLSVSARGARKPRSKFLAGTQLFTYSDFVIFDGGKFNTMAQIDIIENFYDLRNDYGKLCYSNYFLELCEKVLLPNVACDEVLFLLLKALSLLSKDKINPELCARIFEFKFLQLNGYAAELTCCFECGEVFGMPYHFSDNGLVCGNCKKNKPRKVFISEACISALNYILESELGEVFSFKVSDGVLKELRQCSQIFIEAHLEVTIKSLELVEED